MLALSTSWISSSLDDGEVLFKAVECFDVSGVELEYRVTERMYEQLRGPLKRSGLAVTSLHNYFPHPPLLPRTEASGDLFRLSNPEKEDRLRAVQWTTRTIETANDLEAAVVVLHCGYVEMDPKLERLRKLFEEERIESDEAREFIEARFSERSRRKPEYIEALLFSLDRLLRIAEKHQVFLGIENRANYHEIPDPDDLDILFREFSGSVLRYWHDVGHAQTNELLTFIRHEDLLKTYADLLIGVHLHDVRGMDDHLPPGCGTVDFDMVRTHLGDDTIRVLELKPGTSDSEVVEGIAYLREKGIA